MLSLIHIFSGNGVELVLTNAAIDFLANAGYDPEFGARPVKRAIPVSYTHLQGHD